MSSRSFQDLPRMKTNLSSKTLQDGCSRQEIKKYFLDTYFIYEQLFSLIRESKSFYTKPEPLRHPLIFYYGHTACLYINKLFDKGLISQRVNPKFQSIFAVGVDEMDWDDLNEDHYDWPTVREVTNYRQTVKNIVLGVIDRISPEISWNSDAWIIMMGIEHQRIHLETSSAIIRQLPLEEIRPHPEFLDCPAFETDSSRTPLNLMAEVPGFHQEWQRKRENATTYGWDNQFGGKIFNVKKFKASQMLVSNGEFMQFVKDNGYNRPQLWDKEGRAWLKSKQPKMPLWWRYNNGSYTLRTMNKIISMPVDWPVEVNNLQATAFCNWKSLKQGKNIRLPTQDEYYALRSQLKKDQLDWKHGQVGNVNMQYWFSPNPVNMFKTGEFYDIVGNVWQHCSTPIYPFQDFEIHPIYQDFTTPTFDGRHYMIKGGSFVSTGNQAIFHSRYAFRRHFYQFAGFRYVESDNQVTNLQLLDETDQQVQKFLRIHYENNKSYATKAVQLVKQKCANQNDRCLTVGCNVGRIVMEMSKHFSHSYGTDYSARYFQMVTRLFEKGFLNYKDIQINLQDLEIQKNKIILYQMNPENPDSNKINKINIAIFDGLSIRQGTMLKSIQSMKKVMERQAKVFIISTKNRNHVTHQQIKAIINKAELKENIEVPCSDNQPEPVTIQFYQIEL